MLINRIGDIGLAIGICASFLTFKTVDYALTFALIPCVLKKTITFFSFDFTVISIIVFFLF